MGEDVPVGGVKFRAINAFPILRDRPQRIAKFLHIARDSIEIAHIKNVDNYGIYYFYISSAGELLGSEFASVEIPSLQSSAS